MAYLSLYRKYRPQTFDEILGQDHVANTISNAIREDRVAHAYLFTGPRGTGKTSTARILAKAINCAEGPTPSPCGKCDSCVAITNGSSLDVVELDAASHSKVDDTRDVLAGVALATAGSRKKVYVIDEVHMLTPQSFNALLKTLEEPPPHVLFILATTEAHKVLGTIISRTQRFDFRPVPVDVLEKHLAHVAEIEGIDIGVGALGAVARHADGGVRDALSVLDQLSNMSGPLTELDVERLLGGRTEDSYLELFDAVLAGEVGTVFQNIGSLAAEGADPRQLTLGVMAHARALLLLRTTPDPDNLLEMSSEDLPKLAAQAARFSPDSILRILDLVSKAYTEMRLAANHRLLLEVALVRAAAPDTDPGATGLQGRIERLERRIGIQEGEAPPPDVQTQPAPAPPDVQTQPAPAPPDVQTQPAPAPRPQSQAPRQSSSRSQAGRSPSPAPAPAPKRIDPPQPASVDPPVPAAAAPPPQPSPQAAGMPAGVGFGAVKDAWAATLQEVGRKSKRIQALLNPSRPIQLENERLLIEVQSPFHESTMSEERNRAVVVAALQASLGIKPTVGFVARGSGAPPPAESSAAGPSSDANQVPAATPQDEEVQVEDTVALEDSAHDPVELIKQGLGGEVVEERTPR
jgi:DNA polymerase-3 subunit gamma/tau